MINIKPTSEELCNDLGVAHIEIPLEHARGWLLQQAAVENALLKRNKLRTIGILGGKGMGKSSVLTTIDVLLVKISPHCWHHYVKTDEPVASPATLYREFIPNYTTDPVVSCSDSSLDIDCATDLNLGSFGWADLQRAAVNAGGTIYLLVDDLDKKKGIDVESLIEWMRNWGGKPCGSQGCGLTVTYSYSSIAFEEQTGHNPATTLYLPSDSDMIRYINELKNEKQCTMQVTAEKVIELTGTNPCILRYCIEYYKNSIDASWRIFSKSFLKQGDLLGYIQDLASPNRLCDNNAHEAVNPRLVAMLDDNNVSESRGLYAQNNEDLREYAISGLVRYQNHKYWIQGTAVQAILYQLAAKYYPIRRTRDFYDKLFYSTLVLSFFVASGNLFWPRTPWLLLTPLVPAVVAIVAWYSSHKEGR